MAKKSALLSATAIILLYSSVPAYAQSVTNVYDGAGRLIKQTIPNKNLIFLYTYDRNGNLIAKKADVSPPTAPGNLSLSFLRENAANVTWIPSTDDRGIEKYEFSLTSPNSVKSGTLDKSSSTLSFSELQASTTYTFSIKAVDVAGRISTSSTLTFRTKDITIPTRPTLQSLDSDGPVVTLRWQASTDPEGIKEYVVYLNGVEKGRTSSTTYTVTNLPYRQSLSFTVRAIDNYGYVSDASNGSINLIPKDQIDFTGSYRAGDWYTVAWASNNKSIASYRIKRVSLNKGGGTKGSSGGHSTVYTTYSITKSESFSLDFGLYSHDVLVEGLDSQGNVIATSPHLKFETEVGESTNPPGPAV